MYRLYGTSNDAVSVYKGCQVHSISIYFLKHGHLLKWSLARPYDVTVIKLDLYWQSKWLIAQQRQTNDFEKCWLNPNSVEYISANSVVTFGYQSKYTGKYNHN